MDLRSKDRLADSRSESLGRVKPAQIDKEILPITFETASDYAVTTAPCLPFNTSSRGPEASAVGQLIGLQTSFHQQMRTVPREDYLTARGANPRTGVITPSLYSGGTSSPICNASTAKWRRLGDEWVSIAVGQSTPNSSPASSTYSPQSQTVPGIDRVLRFPPKLSCRNARQVFDIQNPCTVPSAAHHNSPAAKQFDKQCSRSKVPLRRGNNASLGFESGDQHAIYPNSSHTLLPTKLQRKAVGSPPSNPKTRLTSFDCVSGRDMGDPPRGFRTEVLSEDQQRSTLAPNHFGSTYYSPDDVGMDLSTAQSTENHVSPRSFLGLSPGDFLEDIPVQFQSSRTSPKLEKPLPALPTSGGPFRSPASMMHQHNVQSLPPYPARPCCTTCPQQTRWPNNPRSEVDATERSRFPVLKLQTSGTGTRTNSRNRLVRRVMDSQEACPYPSKTRPHHQHTCQGSNPLQATGPENRPSEMRQDQLLGQTIRRSRSHSGTTLINPATSVAEPSVTNTTITTTTTPQGQREFTCQRDAMLLNSTFQDRRQGLSMPTLRRQDRSDSIPSVSLQRAMLEDATDHNMTELEPSSKCVALASEDIDHILTHETPGEDGGVTFGSGSAIVSRHSMSVASSRRKDTSGCRFHFGVEQPIKDGNIPTSGSRATTLPRTSSQAAKREADSDTKLERRSDEISSDCVFMRSANILTGHEHCCPICCKQDCHSSCLGHASDSLSTKSSIPGVLNLAPKRPSAGQHSAEDGGKGSRPSNRPHLKKPDNIKSVFTNSTRLRRSFRTRTHETDCGSFTETETEEIAELNTPMQFEDEEAPRVVAATFNAKHANTLPRRSPTSSSLHTLQIPSLIPTIDTFIVPLNAAIMWCKTHRELLDVTIVSFSQLTTMALHVLEVFNAIYEAMAEYGRSGKVRCKRDRLAVAREGAVAVCECIAVVCAIIVIVRITSLAAAIGRAFWIVLKAVCWLLDLGFRAGTW